MGFASFSFAYLAVMGFLPTMLMEGEGLGKAQAAILASIAVAANVVGSLAGGLLLQRGMPRWVLMAATALVLTIFSFGIYSVHIPFVARYVAVLAFSSISGVLPTAVLSGAPLHAPSPERLGATNGLIMQGSSLGQALGPTVMALVAQEAGNWRWSPLVVGVSAASLMACALTLRWLEGDRRRAGLG